MTYWEAGAQIVTALIAAWSTWAASRAKRAVDRSTITVRAVEDQLTPNGGNSMRDAVDSIGRDVTELKETVHINTEKLTGNSDRLATLERRAIDAGWFYRGGN